MKIMYYLMNPGPNVSVDVLDRTKYQGHFVMKQMSWGRGCFSRRQICKEGQYNWLTAIEEVSARFCVGMGCVEAERRLILLNKWLQLGWVFRESKTLYKNSVGKECGKGKKKQGKKQGWRGMACKKTREKTRVTGT